MRNPEPQYSNVIPFPSTVSDELHTGGLVIEEYDQWHNEEAGDLVALCLTRRDSASVCDFAA